MSFMGDFVERLRKDAKAAKVLAEWLGEGGEPVSFARSFWRADICENCPHNREDPRVLEPAIAKAIVEQQEIRLKATLHVPFAIHSCDLCGCVLSLKVWVPLKHVLHGEQAEWPRHCWIYREQNEKATP